MKIKNYIKHCFFLFLIAGAVVSCEKIESPESEFLKGGELVYTGKAEALQALSGKDRIKLSWYLVSDPKITKAKVFWNNPANIDEGSTNGRRNPGRDSTEIAIQRTSGSQLIQATIDRLVEGVYTFDVYTYDNDGHSSVKTEVIGEVYGDSYQGTVSNRPLDSAAFDVNNDLLIRWFGVGQQAEVINIHYTDISGANVVVDLKKVGITPNNPGAFLDSTILVGYKPNTSFKYRTGYLPNPLSIDTFYTAFTEVSDIKDYVPPPPPAAADENLALGKKFTSGSGGNAATLNDGVLTGGWQPGSGNRAGLNVFFHVDLGSVQEFNTVHTFFSKDPQKITYHEVLYTEVETIASNTAWKRAYIKFGRPDGEEIFVSLNGDKTEFVNLKARHIKVSIGIQDAATNINVAEFQVYKKSKVPPPAAE